MDTDTLDGMVYADIVKFIQNDDGTVTVVGKPSSSIGNDIDGQVADPEWLRNALPEWMKWANIREMHQPSAAGVGEKLEWGEDGDPIITARITDPIAVQKVINHVYKGFSIGVKHPKIVSDFTAPGGRIAGGHIIEVSLVDRPSHSNTRFTIAKSANPGTWTDVQSGVTLDLPEEVTMAKVAREAATQPEEIDVSSSDELFKFVSAASRRKAVKGGDAFPDGSFPIRNQDEADKAWNLRGHNENHSTDSIVAHIRKQVKKHGLNMPGDDEGEEGTQKMADEVEKAATADEILDGYVFCDEEQMLVKYTVTESVPLGPSGSMNVGHDEQGHILRKFVPPAPADETGTDEGNADSTGKAAFPGASPEFGSADDADDDTAEKAAHADDDGCPEDDAGHKEFMASKKAAGFPGESNQSGDGEQNDDVQSDMKGKNEGGSGLVKDAAGTDFVTRAAQMALADLFKKAGLDLEGIQKAARKATIKEFDNALDELKGAAAELIKFDNVGGPAGVSDPGSNGTGIRTQFVACMNKINQLAGQIGAGDGDFGHAGTPTPGHVDFGVAQAIHTDRWDLNRDVGTPDLTKAAGSEPDVTKAAQQAAVSTVGTILPDLVKAMTAQVEGLFEPLRQRVEDVEHLARPARPPVTVAERGSVHDPDLTKAAQSETLINQQLQDSLASLSDSDRERALAAVLSVARQNG